MDQESLSKRSDIQPLNSPISSRRAALDHQSLQRITFRHGGHKATVAQKLEIDQKRQHILHRYASVPIFDKFDYEKKLEEAIERNYLENNYEHYLFKHTPANAREFSLELA